MLEAIKKRVSSADGKSQSLLRNIVLSLGVKGGSLFVALFTTPAYIAFFNNNEILGLWFTLLSVLSWILNCDMGIGNGLRNKLVAAISENDEARQRTLVSSSYAFLGAVAIVVALAILACSRIVDWNAVFNIPASLVDRQMLSVAIGVILLAVCLQLILNLVTSILYALQLAFVPGLLNLATNVAMLFYCLATTLIGVHGSILSMAIAYCFAVNVPLAVATVCVFSKAAPQLRPSPRAARWAEALSVLRLGAAFLWLQFMAMLLNNTSSYLITILIGNEAVVEYQIYYRIFTLASSLTLLCSTPIWSATTKAQAEDDYRWVLRVFKLFAVFGVAIVVAQFALCVPLQLIFDLWLGEGTIEAEPLPSLAFALYGSLVVWSYVVTCFANGLNELRLQTILLTFGAVINIPIACVLARLTDSYLSVVVANIIAYIPYLVGQTVWLIRYLKMKTASKQTS